MESELLAGGVANAGAVVRVGEHVLRPACPHARSIHALLRHVRAAGFDGVPEVVGSEPDGRERLAFVPGDVPLAPLPAWACDERVLASTAALLRRFHVAAAGFAAPAGATWSDELADPHGGSLPCHNDVCPENVVFRDGTAVVLLDFDFTAPGRAVWDLAQLAKLWLPLEDPRDAARLGRDAFDPWTGLRTVADAYGLSRADRAELVAAIGDAIDVGDRFVTARVAHGDRGFTAMFERLGGAARISRRRAWFERARGRLQRAVL